jgi:hypothetical protein
VVFINILGRLAKAMVWRRMLVMGKGGPHAIDTSGPDWNTSIHRAFGFDSFHVQQVFGATVSPSIHNELKCAKRLCGNTHRRFSSHKLISLQLSQSVDQTASYSESCMELIFFAFRHDTTTYNPKTKSDSPPFRLLDSNGARSHGIIALRNQKAVDIFVQAIDDDAFQSAAFCERTTAPSRVALQIKGPSRQRLQNQEGLIHVSAGQ